LLPDLDGVQMCRTIRDKYFCPIIMLTAKAQDTDKILGLTLGADDYISKPFNPLEVMARVKTQLRRYVRYNCADKGTPAKTNEYDINGLVINNDTHKCFLFKEEISLTPIEFSILWYLCVHRGNVVSSEELFEAVWCEKYLDSNNTVMAHIGRLREKLHEPPRTPKFVKTVWGVGYKVE
ncbi:MAG: response regulator transcription factor, partial [Oscillospiraceae bacterium]